MRGIEAVGQTLPVRRGFESAYVAPRYRREREHLSAIDAWALGRCRWWCLSKVRDPRRRASNDTLTMFICELLETVGAVVGEERQQCYLRQALAKSDATKS